LALKGSSVGQKRFSGFILLRAETISFFVWVSLNYYFGVSGQKNERSFFVFDDVIKVRNVSPFAPQFAKAFLRAVS